MSSHALNTRISQRKHRFPWFLLSLFWLIVALFLIFKVDPIVVRDIGIHKSYLPLHVVVFMGVSAAVMMFTLQFYRAMVWGLLITLALIMRLWGLGNWINLTLLLSILITAEYLWRISNEKVDASAKKLDNS